MTEQEEREYAEDLKLMPEPERDIDAEYRAHVSRQATFHGAPPCRCGSRNTRGLGKSALLRQCQACGATYVYRLYGGRLIPFSPAVAAAIDEERAR